MTRVYTREEALRRGAKPVAEEVEREESRKHIESWFDRDEPETKRGLSKTDKYVISKFKKKKSKKGKKGKSGGSFRKGVVSAFGLGNKRTSVPRVRF